MAKFADALHTISTTISGIPCQVALVSYYSSKGNSSADNDMDYYGYTEADCVVLDRKGYEAQWLAKKMTELDKERVENEVIESYIDCQSAMEEDYYY